MTTIGSIQRYITQTIAELKTQRNYWNGIVGDGVPVANKLVNLTLQQQYGQNKQLWGPGLKEFDGLENLFVYKLNCAKRQHHEKLSGIYDKLTKVFEKMSRVTAQADKILSDAKRGMGEQRLRESPVFKTYSLAEVVDMIHEIVSMYEKELSLKREIVLGLPLQFRREPALLYLSAWLNEPYLDPLALSRLDEVAEELNLEPDLELGVRPNQIICFKVTTLNRNTPLLFGNSTFSVKVKFKSDSPPSDLAAEALVHGFARGSLANLFPEPSAQQPPAELQEVSMVEDLMQEKTGVHVAETTSDQQPEPALQGGTSISTSESLPNVDSIMLPFLEESQPDSFMHMFDGDLSNWLGGRDLMNGSSQATSSVLSGRLIKNEGVKVEGAPWPGSHFQQGGDLLSMSGVNADESSQRPSSVSSSRLIKAEKLAFDENARQNSQAQRLSTPASRVGSAASRAWNGIEAAVATAAQRPSTAFSRPSTSQTVTTNDSSVLAAAKSTFFHNLRETPPPSFRRSSQPVSLKGRFADEEPSLSQMFKNVLTLLPREDRMDQSFNVKSVDIESSNSKRPSSTVSGRARTPKSPWTRVPGDFDDKASCAGSVASSTQWSVGGDSVTPHDSVSQVGVSKDRDIPMNEIPPPQPTPAHPNKLFGITELASALKSSPTRSSSVTPRDSFLKGSHVKLEEPNTSNRNVTLMPSAMSSRSPQSTSKLSFSKTSVSSSSKALSKSHYVTFLPSYEDDDILDTPSSSSGFISKPSLQMKPGAANDVEMVIERAPMVETNPSGSAANVSQQSPSGTKFTAEQQATSATTPWSKLSHHSQIRRLKLATADAASNVESPSLSSRIDRPNSSSTKGKRLWSNADIHSSPIHARSSSESGMRESYGNQPAIKRLRSMELGEARPSTHSGRFHIVDDERRGRSLEPVATPHGMRRSGSAPPDVAGEDEPQTSGDRRAEGAGAAGHGGDMMDLGDDKIMGRDGIENATNRSSQATENKRKRRAVIEDEDDEELRQREELLRYYKEKKASSEMSIDSHAQGKKRNRRGHVIAEEEEGDEQKQLFNAKNCAKRQTSAMSIDSMDFQSKVENSRRSGGMARDPDFRVVTPLSTTSSTSMDSLQFQQQPRRTVRFQSQLSYAQSPRTLPTDDMSSIATSELTDAVDGDAKGEGALAGANVGLDETVKDKIILCISFKHRSLGCAYYSVFHSTLYLMEDMEENDQFELVKMLIYQIAPTTIVTHARVDEAFMDILKAASQESGGRARQGAKPNVEIRPSTDFSYATAKTRLLSIRLSEKTARAQNSNIPPGMNPPNIMNEEHDVDRSANVGRKGEVPPFRFATSTASNVQSERTEMYLYLEGIVSLQCKEMVGCAGALLSYISKMRLTGEILEDDDVDPMDQDDDEDDENDTSIFGPKSRRPKKNRASKNEILSKFMEIHAVEQFSLKRYMHVNADTLCSLQIFQDEAHPNMHSSRSKEGLSLFGILDMTHTAPGRFLLKRWFLRPSLDIEALRRRHDTIEAFMRPENGHIVESVRSSLKHVKNIPKILFSMRTKVSVTEWQALLRFCFYTLKIRSSIRDMTEMNLPIMKKIEEAFVVQELKDVGSFINNVIDFDQSIAEGRVSVKPFIDDELDELKRNYHGLDDLLVG
ncbi:MutS protein msh5 [Quaeritorhiza haematococci]|nr:MutS protein msh5 [Quaeritorhiza haematococci]